MATRQSILFALLGLTWVVPVSQSHAESILYWRDSVVGTDRMAQALSSLGGSYTVVTATSAADFQTKIQTGNYDLGIFFVQNQYAENYTNAINALGAHVAAGGSAIYADWSRRSFLAGQFGASYTGTANYSSFTVTSSELGQGVSSPVSLYNPGWGIYSTGLDGISAALFADNTDAIVLGNGGRSIVNGFLSDTFVTGEQGVRLYTNEIEYVLGVTAVPVPAAFILGALGLGLVGWVKRRQA